MKFLIIGLGLALFAVNAQAKSLDAYCMISIQEKVKKEIVKIDKLIEFKCDNYGADATVESPSKRFLVTAFSEESCTPQLLILDRKLKTLSTTILMENEEADEDGFETFRNRVIHSGIVLGVKSADEVFTDKSQKDSISIRCSSSKELVENKK